MKSVVAALLMQFALPALFMHAKSQIVERAPTPFVEDSKPVTLEVVIFKPEGAGPFPALMFNHGSTGRGDNPALFTRTYTSASVAGFFNDRGWLVAFPQRRGRGKSDGAYAEGFEPARWRYSCSPQYSLPGMERALQDLDAALAYLKGRADVDGKRLLIGGQSRGGILAIVHSGTRPGQFLGAINFVGGWMSDSCPDVKAINTASFVRGAPFRGPTLWLYGENDPFYGMEHSRSNFDAFTAAGGKGTFLAYSVGPGRSGHGLIGSPDLWREAVAAFVQLAR